MRATAASRAICGLAERGVLFDFDTAEDLGDGLFGRLRAHRPYGATVVTLQVDDVLGAISRANVRLSADETGDGATLFCRHDALLVSKEGSGEGT